MDKQRFEDLKESIVEAGKVMRGEMKPNREFTFETDVSETESLVETWAVCIENDDEKLLIPGKLYFIKISGEAVLVRDEEDEATLYSKDFFIPVALPQEVTQKLSSLAEVA